MVRYKIVKMDTKISDAEIMEKMDFEALLNRYRQQVRYKKIIGGLVLFLAVAFMVGWLYSGFEKQPTNETPFEEIRAMDSVSVTVANDSVTVPHLPKYNRPEEESKGKETTTRQIQHSRSQDLEFTEAVPPYGIDSLISYLYVELNKMSLPATAGKVVVAFTINRKGQPENIKILQGVSEQVDSGLVKAITKMPAWQPARLDGKPVSSVTTLPLEIRIEKND